MITVCSLCIYVVLLSVLHTVANRLCHKIYGNVNSIDYCVQS